VSGNSLITFRRKRLSFEAFVAHLLDHFEAGPLALVCISVHPTDAGAESPCWRGVRWPPRRRRSFRASIRGGSGTPLYANRATLDYIGLAMADVVKPGFREPIFHPDDIRRLAQYRQSGLAKGVPFQLSSAPSGTVISGGSSFITAPFTMGKEVLCVGRKGNRRETRFAPPNLEVEDQEFRNQ
jgi:hypothetical protein